MPGFMQDIQGAGTSGLLAQTINGVGVSGLTATGSTQAGALLVTACSNLFTTTAASTGARLPRTDEARISGGDIIAIYNNGANALLVYPPVGFKIGTLSANATISVPAGKAALFGALGDNNYVYFLSA